MTLFSSRIAPSTQRMNICRTSGRGAVIKDDALMPLSGHSHHPMLLWARGHPLLHPEAQRAALLPSWSLLPWSGHSSLPHVQAVRGSTAAPLADDGMGRVWSFDISRLRPMIRAFDASQQLWERLLGFHRRPQASVTTCRASNMAEKPNRCRISDKLQARLVLAWTYVHETPFKACDPSCGQETRGLMLHGPCSAFDHWHELLFDEALDRRGRRGARPHRAHPTDGVLELQKAHLLQRKSSKSIETVFR